MPNPQPTLIREANEYCSRIVYIDMNSNAQLNAQRSNIRKKLTSQMQELEWYPRSPTTSSFIFYKRDDKASWKPEEEVKKAIIKTQVTYEDADFQFAILKPICCTENIQDQSQDFVNLFRNCNSNSD